MNTTKPDPPRWPTPAEAAKIVARILARADAGRIPVARFGSSI